MSCESRIDIQRQNIIMYHTPQGTMTEIQPASVNVHLMCAIGPQLSSNIWAKDNLQSGLKADMCVMCVSQFRPSQRAFI